MALLTIDPILLRRNAALLVPGVLLLGLLAWDLGVHRPARARLDRVSRAAEAAGISVRPGPNAVVMPPAVRALLEGNGMEQAKLAELQRTGALAADLLRAATEVANRHGIRVTATEPGMAMSAGGETVVRAHLRATGTYVEFVGMLDALARDHRLLAVDQFVLTPSSGGQLAIDLRVSRLVVRRGEAKGGRP